MEFRKCIEIPNPDFDISHQNKLFLMGSCFIDNIGKFLVKNKFDVCLNPFGVLYNPQSISQSIRFLISNKVFSDKEIIFDKGLYHSFYHHSSFSDINLNSLLDEINNSRKLASEALVKSDVLVITFGSSLVYHHIKSGINVSNCHKINAKEFEQEALSVEDIYADWSSLIKTLASTNPNIKLLFTISPIRHWKDGAHGNQLSKATLLLAVDRLMKNFKNCFYFPAYEIMLDELRDYRFYADDMIHPSDLAIKYIWERFSDSYFSDTSKEIIKYWNKLLQSIHHRPFNEQTEAHKHFIRQTLLKLQDFQNKYPYFDCYREVQLLQQKLE